MHDGELEGLTGQEQELARRLDELGPLMREQERAEAGIDQVFTRNLRAHLVYGEGQAPHPAFARDLRARLIGAPAARRVPPVFGRRPSVWIGTATAALAALLVGLLVALRSPQPAHVSAFAAPYPTRADLIFSFPAPSTVIRQLTPLLSLVHPGPGIPYAGHLQLTAGRLARGAARLRAYRLAFRSNVASIARRLLGIHSSVRHVVTATGTWAVAADGGGPSRQPLHSLATSLRTGELIYHDRRNTRLPRADHPLDRAHAVAAARKWLTRLGWPGRQMPLRFVGTVGSMPKVLDVVFSWIGVGQFATPAATLWVTPDRSIIEAWVWPPVSQSGLVPARSLSAAWTEVRDGKLPLAVNGVSPTTRANGVGRVQRTTIVSVLSPGARGTLYLVPTYRFEGRARISGRGVHVWYSLAPGAQK